MTNNQVVSVLWFGTGSMTAQLLPLCKQQHVQILAFIDERPGMRGKTLMDVPIISLADIPNYDFEYILVGARPYAHIAEKLKHCGVHEDKLISLDFESNALMTHRHYASFLNCVTHIAESTPLFSKIFYLDKIYTCDWIRHAAGALSSRNKSDALSIAINIYGAIGDALVCLAWVIELYKILPYNAKIYLFGKTNLSFAAHQYEFIETVSPQQEFAEASGYDIKISIRHIITVSIDHISENRFPDIMPIVDSLRTFAEQYKKYALPHYYGTHDNAWGRLCRLHGWNRWDELGANEAIPFSRKNRATFIPDSEAYSALRLYDLEHKPFVTLHLGGDAEACNSALQIKNWPASSWSSFCRIFKNKYPHILLVQLGTKEAEGAIKGVDLCLAGKTTLHESAVILKQALLHIDCDSGLAHLRTALGGKSVVLFGPTPADFFGYESNINIESPACTNCWWLRDDWFTRCPKGLDEPECMAAIAPDKVLQAVDDTLAECREYSYAAGSAALYSKAGRLAYEPILEDICQTCGVTKLPISQHIAGTCGTVIHASKQWEYPYVINEIRALSTQPMKIADVGSGRGMLSWYLAKQGHSVTSYDLSFAHGNKRESDRDVNRRFIQFAKAQGFNAEFGSIFNLPAEDESFDIVACVSVVEHITWKFYAFKEMLRILKPGGKLIVTYDLTLNKANPSGASRIDVFTARKITHLLQELSASPTNIHTEAKIRASIKDIVGDEVKGMCEDLTVGGFVLTKSAKSLADPA